MSSDVLSSTSLTSDEMTSGTSDGGIDSGAFASLALKDVDGQQIPSSQKVGIKLLISNAAAGVVIGRSGQNRAKLQSLSDARIQLSRANTYYPGTTERVLLLSGTIKGVLTALYHIMLKLTGADDVEGPELGPRRVSACVGGFGRGRRPRSHRAPLTPRCP